MLLGPVRSFETAFLGEIITSHLYLCSATRDLMGYPLHVLKFKLRLDRSDFAIQHVPGKLLYTTDALSQAPLAETDADYLEFQEEVEMLDY